MPAPAMALRSAFWLCTAALSPMTTAKTMRQILHSLRFQIGVCTALAPSLTPPVDSADAGGIILTSIDDTATDTP